MNSESKEKQTQDHWFKPWHALVLGTMVLVLIVYLCLNFLNPSEPEELEFFGDSSSQSTALNEEDQELFSTSDGEKGVSPAEESSEKSPEEGARERLTTTGEQCFCISGRVVIKNGNPLPPDLEVTCLRKRPPFSFQSLTVQAQRRSSPAYRSEEKWSKALDLPVATVDKSGAFLLKGVPEGEVFLYVLHPFLHPHNSKSVKPYLLKAMNAGSAPPETILLLEEGGVIEGKIIQPDGTGAESTKVTLGEEINPFFMFSAKKGRISSFSIKTSKEGRFRFEQVPVDKRLVLDASRSGFAPTRKGSLYARAGAVFQVEVPLNIAASVLGKVEDPSGKPMSGIKIKLFQSHANLSDIEKNVEKTVRTNDEGKFAFSDLPAGSYIIRLIEPGYLREVVKGIKLIPGQVIKDLKLIVRKGMSISGTVRDQDLQPIVNVRIRVTKTFSLFSIGDAITDQMDPVNGGTDEKGYFNIYGLEKNGYDLEFTSSGFTTVKKEKISAGTTNLSVVMDKGGIIAGIVISGVTGEPVTEYNIQVEQVEGMVKSIMDPFGMKSKSMRPVNHEKGKFILNDLKAGSYNLTFKAEGFSSKKMEGFSLAAGEEVRGVIVALPAESGISGIALDIMTLEPVEGVMISQKSGIEALMETVMGGDTAATDENGRFRFGNLPAGPVRLVASHPQYKEVKLEKMVLLEGESIEGIEILLSRGSIVRGYVTMADKTPLPGEDIMIAQSTGKNLRYSETDRDGYYEIGGLTKGTYNVTMMPHSMALFSDDFIGSLFSSMQTQVIKLSDDEVRECSFIVDDDDKEGTLLTGVVKENNNPATHVMLQLYENVPLEKGNIPQIKTTDKEGRYRFPNVKPGKYTILAMKTSGMMAGAYSGCSYKINIPNTSEFTFDIDLPGGAISGTVKDRDTLSPIKNARIILLKSDGKDTEDILSTLMQNKMGEVYTDDEGRYKISNIREGTYALRAGGTNVMGMDSGGYAQRLFEDIKIGKGRHKERFDIKLERAGIIEGKVTDSSGIPIAGAMIYMKGPDQKKFDPFTECNTDSSGFFQYKGLSPGKCSIMIKHSDFDEMIESDVWIEKGKTTTVNVALQKSG